MAIDPKTGLEQLPDGYRWRISRSPFMGRTWVVVKLQKKTRLGWRTVTRDETQPGHFWWNLHDLASAWFNRDAIKARRRAERAKVRSLYGVYPPKKYGGAE